MNNLLQVLGYLVVVVSGGAVLLLIVAGVLVYRAGMPPSEGEKP